MRFVRRAPRSSSHCACRRPNSCGVSRSCTALRSRLTIPAWTSTKVPFAQSANPTGSKVASIPRMCPSPRSRSDSPGGASITAPPPPVDQPRSAEPYAPAPAYAGSGRASARPRSILNTRKIAPPISKSSRSPTPPPKPPPMPPNSMEPRSPPSAKPARPPIRPPKMPGRADGCCIGWGEVWVGLVALEGLDGVVEGEAGDEYEREPRLPPLVARAHTDAVSSSSSETSDSPTMSTKALVRMFASYVILARPATGRGPLRNEEHLARRLPSLQRPVRVGRVLQGELELGAELELAVADPTQELVRALEQLRARGDVVVEARARQEERALGVERLRIEGPDRAARLAVERHHAARRQAVEPLVERGLTDRVVHDLQPLAVGESLHLGLEILLRVENDVRGASFARQLRFVLGGDRADDTRSPHLRDLAQQQPHAAGRRVHEARVAALERIGRAGEIVRGQPLQHRRGALVRAQSGRQGHQTRSRDHGVLRVSAGNTRVSDLVTDLHLAHVRTDRGDRTAGFQPEGQRQRELVLTRALVHVDVVDTGGVHLHRGLAGLRGGIRHVFVAKDFGTAGRVDSNGFHEDPPGNSTRCGGIIAPGSAAVGRGARAASGTSHRPRGRTEGNRDNRARAFRKP